MAAKAAVYVSQRLQRPVFAILCLFAAQLLISISSCHPEHVPMAARAGEPVRVQISH